MQSVMKTPDIPKTMKTATWKHGEITPKTQREREREIKLPTERKQTKKTTYTHTHTKHRESNTEKTPRERKQTEKTTQKKTQYHTKQKNRKRKTHMKHTHTHTHRNKTRHIKCHDVKVCFQSGVGTNSFPKEEEENRTKDTMFQHHIHEVVLADAGLIRSSIPYHCWLRWTQSQWYAVSRH